MTTAATLTALQARNIDQVRAFYALWDQRPLTPAAIAESIALTFHDHNRPQSDPSHTDREVIVGLSSMIAEGFADGIHQIEVLEAVGADRVLAYWRFTGTHTGMFFGIPATGRQITFCGTDLFTLHDGLIVEQRHVEELFQAMGQLGIISPSG